MMRISDIVDIEKFPVGQIDSARGFEFAEECKRRYQETGLCMLPGFVMDKAIDVLTAESGRYIGDAYFCDNTHNAYLTDDDGAANDEVSRRQEKTFVGSVPYDKIPTDTALNTLYQWDPLKDFIGYVLGKETFHRFADPFGACSVNVFVDGGVHGWHFDESEFTVTLMLQAPEQGGEFEYVPLIRGLKNEKEIIGNVLDGRRDDVVTLPFTPGTLLIFGGRQTLHRVTRIQGDKPRLVPVLCYAEEAGKQNSHSVRKFFWGREAPGDQLQEAS